MKFRDRSEAGKKLGDALKKAVKKGEGLIVIALPRGGVVLGREVADALAAPLDIVVPRKIGAEFNEEFAIGALTETGRVIWNGPERASADPSYVKRKVEEETAEAKRRLETYRKGMPPRDLKGKTAIVVDDGIATGLTMRAALATVREEGAKRVIAAVPVVPPDTFEEIRGAADEWVVLDKPAWFQAVGSFYDEFGQVDDETVVKLLRA